MRSVSFSRYSLMASGALAFMPRTISSMSSTFPEISFFSLSPSDSRISASAAAAAAAASLIAATNSSSPASGSGDFIMSGILIKAATPRSFSKPMPFNVAPIFKYSSASLTSKTAPLRSLESSTDRNTSMCPLEKRREISSLNTASANCRFRGSLNATSKKR